MFFTSLSLNIITLISKNVHRQRRGLTFSVPSAEVEDNSKTVSGQERLKLWLRPRNGLGFRDITREYENDAESNVQDKNTTGQLEINYQHLLENLSEHTGRGIIIRNTKSTNPMDWRIETRLVGQTQVTTDEPTTKSLGLEYASYASNANDKAPDKRGIKVRPWNGVITNNDEGTGSGTDRYLKAHQGVSAYVEHESALRFKDTSNTVGDGSDVPNGQRKIMINIGKHYGSSDATRSRQGLTFETGTPTVPRHGTGTHHGWSGDASNKLRIWENTFQGLEFRNMSTQSFHSLAAATNTRLNDQNTQTRPTYTIGGNDSSISVGTASLNFPINPAMDPNEDELTGMLQIKKHGGLRFRYRGQTWSADNNPYQAESTSPTNQLKHHGRLESQVNYAKGLEVATETSYGTRPTTSDIYPKTGENAGDLQLRIEEKTGLRFVADYKDHHQPGCDGRGGYGCGDANLKQETRTNGQITPTVHIPPRTHTVNAYMHIPSFNTSTNTPNGISVSLTEGGNPIELPNGVYLSGGPDTRTINDVIVTIPKRDVTVNDPNSTAAAIPPRPVAIARNQARLQSIDTTASSRTMTMERPRPDINFTYRPTDPSWKPNQIYNSEQTLTIPSTTYQLPGKDVPHSHFTEDDRIIIDPELHHFNKTGTIPKQNGYSLGSYTAMYCWKVPGSDGKDYWVTMPVNVTFDSIDISAETVNLRTVFELYSDGKTHVRIPESDQFQRDQGKLRLIIDPNQGLGFNANSFTNGTTIVKNGSENPHDWMLKPNRRDADALRIKVNFDRGIHFRRDGVDPYNTYKLNKSFDDETNRSGTNGQLEVKVNANRGIQFRSDGSSNDTTSTNSVPYSGDHGQIEVKINTDDGMRFRSDNSSLNTYTDGSLTSSGNTGQIEVHILGDNRAKASDTISGLNINTSSTSDDGGLRFDTRTGVGKGSLYIDTRWVTKNLKTSSGVRTVPASSDNTIDNSLRGATEGYLQARIGKGLMFDNGGTPTDYTPIQVRLGQGMEFDSSNDTAAIRARLGAGIKFVSTNQTTDPGNSRINANLGVGIEFTPNSSGVVDNNSTIRLGRPSSIELGKDSVTNVETNVGSDLHANRTWDNGSRQTHSHRLPPDTRSGVWEGWENYLSTNTSTSNPPYNSRPSLLMTDKNQDVVWEPLRNIIQPILDIMNQGGILIPGTSRFKVTDAIDTMGTIQIYGAPHEMNDATLLSGDHNLSGTSTNSDDLNGRGGTNKYVFAYRNWMTESIFQNNTLYKLGKELWEDGSGIYGMFNSKIVSLGARPISAALLVDSLGDSAYAITNTTGTDEDVWVQCEADGSTNIGEDKILEDDPGSGIRYKISVPAGCMVFVPDGAWLLSPNGQDANQVTTELGIYVYFK